MEQNKAINNVTNNYYSTPNEGEREIDERNEGEIKQDTIPERKQIEEVEVEELLGHQLI